MQVSSTLTSLAILKVNIDEDERDYIDYLATFILHVLKIHAPDPVTDESVSKSLLEDFGLNVPLRGIQIVLRRLARKKYIKKGQDHTYHVEQSLPHVDLNEKRLKATREISRVYNTISKYAKDKFNVQWTDSKIENTLLAFLDNFGVDYLRSYVFKTALPTMPDTVPKDQFIISNFIHDSYESSDPIFESIYIIVKGQMYANALVCPDLESLEKKFNNLTFYIDSPVILNILKLQGTLEYISTSELFNLIKHLRGRIAVFDHTIEELKNILVAVELNMESPSAEGRVIREVRNAGIKKSDIILIREQIDDRLKKFGINIVPTPPYKINFQISEQELQDAVEDEIIYRNPNALKYDINSIRSIYVLRKGLVPIRLEDSRAIFVTSNVRLAKAAYRVGRNHTSTKEVSSIITDYSLTNVAWLKAPLGAPELPKTELLSTCYAAMEPSKPLWAFYLKEMELLLKSGTISVDDHAVLRCSPIATKELMNMTLGEERALTGGSIKDILRRVKESLTEEKDRELAELKVENNNMISDVMKQKSEELAIGRSALEIERLKKEKLEKEQKELYSNLYWLSDKLARNTTLIFKIILFPVLLFASYASTSLTTPYVVSSFILTSVANVAVFIGIAWGFLNLYCGLSVKSLSVDIEKKLRSWIFSLMVKRKS